MVSVSFLCNVCCILCHILPRVRDISKLHKPTEPRESSARGNIITINNERERRPCRDFARNSNADATRIISFFFPPLAPHLLGSLLICGVSAPPRVCARPECAKGGLLRRVSPSQKDIFILYVFPYTLEMHNIYIFVGLCKRTGELSLFSAIQMRIAKLIKNSCALPVCNSSCTRTSEHETFLK